MSNPLNTALSSGGPLSSSFKRRRYYKEKIRVVELVEYILEPKENRSYQYVTILESLIQILGKENIRDQILSKAQEQSSPHQYKSYRDGTVYKENSFYSEDWRITLVLYIDEVEICNPLGTSRKKHKTTAVYRVFGNMPHTSWSSLNSVYLALLCKSVDLKRSAYNEVLAPLLKDIAILERDGVYISSVGQNVNGSVFCVVADNLGAHSISGLVENFSGPYVCQFCLGHGSKNEKKEVRLAGFPARTKGTHATHLLTMT